MEIKAKHTMSLHNSQKLDDDLRRGSDQDLSLTSLLSVGNSLKSVSENRSASHVELYLHKLVNNDLRITKAFNRGCVVIHA
jgi:hypothetical protein